MPCIISMSSLFGSKSSWYLQSNGQLIKHLSRFLVSSIPIHHTREYHKSKCLLHLSKPCRIFSRKICHLHQICNSSLKSSRLYQCLKISKCLIKILMLNIAVSFGNICIRSNSSISKCFGKTRGIYPSQCFIWIAYCSILLSHISTTNIIDNKVNF